MSQLNRITFIILIGFVAGATLVACSSNPVDEDDHDHAEAEGLVLEINGVNVVTVSQGNVSGQITVANGASTGHISVEFLDHSGQHLHMDELGAEFSMSWTIVDISIVDVEQVSRWVIRIRGKATGSTSIELMLNHGEHADFRTPPIPVEVTA